MATLYITEFEASGNAISGAQLQVAYLPEVTTQKITFTTSSVQSAALDTKTRFVRIHTTAACHVAVGTNPTATTDNMRMIADSVEYFGVRPGYKIAVIG
jgi:hypothetical protein